MVGLRMAIDFLASSVGQGMGFSIWFVLRGHQMQLPPNPLEIYLVGEVLCFLSLALFDLYVPTRSLLDLRENRQLLRAWFTALAGTRLFLFLMGIPVAISLLLSVWVWILPSLYFGRHFFHWAGERLHRAGIGETNALVYGAGETGMRLVRELRRLPELGIHVSGFIDDGIAVSMDEEVPILGDYSKLDSLLSGGQIQRLYIALPQVPRRTVLDILEICRRHKIVFQIVPTLADQILSLVEVQDLDGVPLLGPHPLVMSGGPRIRKRILDLVIALPLLLIISPILLAILPLIRRNLGGSALVRIPAVGAGEQPFLLLRLRTMPEKFRPELARIPFDDRLTPLGKFLRSSLLEIAPELLNVVSGDLSMVGPRPLGLREAASLDPRHRFRLSLPPGLTGLWKIDPRAKISLTDELELDLQYLRLRSFLLDITVLLRSLGALVRKRRI